MAVGVLLGVYGCGLYMMSVMPHFSSFFTARDIGASSGFFHVALMYCTIDFESGIILSPCRSTGTLPFGDTLSKNHCGLFFLSARRKQTKRASFKVSRRRRFNELGALLSIRSAQD